MLTKSQMVSAEKALTAYLLNHYGTDLKNATEQQLYVALAAVANQFIYEKRGKCYNQKNAEKKTVHYMCIEFLIGKNLRNNLWNLELEGFFANLLKENNKNIDDVYRIEKDAGLGNGGLGRLASCFLDSLASLNYPAFGHSIKYEYGLFNQKIIDGKQVELSFREYELLKYLLDNENIALSRDKILNTVWNYDYYGDSRTIDSHIKKIRHKLGKKGKHIQTIRGIGYKFEIK